jgi:RibD C-terminal domain
MRKIIVFNIISLDGYHTGPDNDVSVMLRVMGGVFDTYMAERLRAADKTLVGRVSFQLFNSFWPEVAKDPTSEKWTPGQREISQAGESLPTIVVSDTLAGNWPDVRMGKGGTGGSSNNLLYALRPTDGHLIWHRQIPLGGSGLYRLNSAA